MSHIEGILSAGDEKRHITHEFTLDNPASRLHIRLRYARGPADLGNMLTLTLFDPAGFRGEGHRSGDSEGEWHIHDISIADNDATYGFIAGAIRSGTWRIVINTHRISATCPYQLDIDTSDALGASDAINWAHVNAATDSVNLRGCWQNQRLIGIASEYENCRSLDGLGGVKLKGWESG